MPKGRFLNNINAVSKTDFADKRGMRYVRVNAPAGATSGKYYPVVVMRSAGSVSELASRVIITTATRTAGDPMNNCEFNGFVMPGGWTDRGRYAYGMFWQYQNNERAIHSIMMSNKGDDLRSVFYVDGAAFPVFAFTDLGTKTTSSFDYGTKSTNNTGAHTHSISGTANSAGAHQHKSSGAFGGTNTSIFPNGYTAISNPSAGIMSTTSGSGQTRNAGKTSSDGAHTHSLSGTAASAGAHAHTVGIGAHTHSVAIGSHGHTITVNAAGNAENTVKNIAFNYIVRLA
ncbi:hypothetical protein F6S98_18410 [Escherichia coli]|nr:hypothetical protein [Escherichia coli]HBB1430303.1 hypothetical protein [Escherichia coli]HBB1658877.1 hypothetical protein [Escherichia coli]